jgi:hypothetical protein
MLIKATSRCPGLLNVHPSRLRQISYSPEPMICTIPPDNLDNLEDGPIIGGPAVQEGCNIKGEGHAHDDNYLPVLPAFGDVIPPCVRPHPRSIEDSASSIPLKPVPTEHTACSNPATSPEGSYAPPPPSRTELVEHLQRHRQLYKIEKNRFRGEGLNRVWRIAEPAIRRWDSLMEVPEEDLQNIVNIVSSDFGGISKREAEDGIRRAFDTARRGYWLKPKRR